MKTNLMVATGGALAVVGVLQMTIFPFNSSPSIPMGIYMRTFSDPTVGSVVRFPVPAKATEALKGKAPEHVMKLLENPHTHFMKNVVGIEGDTMCVKNGRFTVSSQPLGEVKKDWQAWSGCKKLGHGEIAVSTPHPLSYDSRYYGAVDASTVQTVVPVLTW